jgi:hypothetical protein
VEEKAVASCDLSPFVHRVSKKPAIGPLKVDFRFSDRTLDAKVMFNETEVGSCKAQVAAGL